jgi:alpha-tubulin suppressor-like RCC1 family protein
MQAIAAGNWTGLSLPSLFTWGYNNYGQLGQNNLTYRSSPTQVGALTDWAQGSGGQNFCAAIKTNGTLWSWGQNNFGKLGQGNTINYSSPVQVGALTDWSQVSAARITCAAIKTNGSLWSWGRSNDGQLGQNNLIDRSSPVQIGALTGWSSIKMGQGSGSGSAVLSLKTNGSIWSWGSNPHGELGLGNRTDYSSPKQIGALTIWQSVGMQDGHAMAILGS